MAKREANISHMPTNLCQALDGALQTLFHLFLKAACCLHFAVEKTVQKVSWFACHYRANISFQVCLSALVLFLPHCCEGPESGCRSAAQGHAAGLPQFSSFMYSFISDLVEVPSEPLCVRCHSGPCFGKAELSTVPTSVEQKEGHQRWQSRGGMSSVRMLFCKSLDPGQPRVRQRVLLSFVKL